MEKTAKFVMVLSCFLASCVGCRLPSDRTPLGDIEKVGMLREGMDRSKVNRILDPLKEGMGYSVGGGEHGFYWLSAESGVWLDYSLRSSRKSFPEDRLISPNGTLEVSVIDKRTGKWNTIPVSQSK
jgi:hypothetical protein